MEEDVTGRIPSSQRFELLVDAVTEYAIYMLDPKGRVSSWNRGAQRIKGHEASEILGRHFSIFFTEEDRRAGKPVLALDIARSSGRFEDEGWRLRKDGTKFWASAVLDAIHDKSGRLIGFGKVTRDMTERREAQRQIDQMREQLAHAQKMEAIGHLTGGIAHDFNNLLQVMTGNIALLQSQIGDNPRAAQRLRNMALAADRGAKLTRQLLAFARRQPLQPRVVDLAQALTEAANLLHRTLGDNIEVETVVAGGLWNTFVDVTQLENALLNLALNARDAMANGGKLTIELRNAYLDQHYAARHADVKAGEYVLLAVTDSGIGMTPQQVERAFEPFFTTKPEGTGLGLSQVYGFVKQSEGHVKIYSEPGQGTTVKLYLPRVRAEAEPELTWSAEGTSGQGEQVLVVEDDAEVRSAVADMVADLGYRVLQAADAVNALAILRSGANVDLLFTDVVMPGAMNGRQLATSAKELAPTIAVLFTSGYTENAIIHHGRLDDDVILLSKPYDKDELALKIRLALDLRARVPATEVSGSKGNPG
jgi:PAS domain S-box-containing protein